MRGSGWMSGFSGGTSGGKDLAGSNDGIEVCPLQHKPPSREVWLVTRRQDRKTLSISTVADYLTRLFADEQPGLFALLPQVVDAVRVPVIAAGGVAETTRGTRP
jgi:hypothetical protein